MISLTTIRTTITYVIIVLLVWGCGQDQGKSPLTIATAASMQYAMDSLKNAFAENTGINSEVITGASGNLTAQIVRGAPYDIFFAADMKYPHALYESGHALAMPKSYARGALVIWTLDETIELEISTLTREDINHIAMANPKTAPYGEATLQILHHYQIYNAVKKKIVNGESIAQTNQFITSGNAELGFTAKSVVMAPRLMQTGRWTEVDQGAYDAIEQGVVILTNRKINRQHALDFVDFVFAKKGRDILGHFGYKQPDSIN